MPRLPDSSQVPKANLQALRAPALSVAVDNSGAGIANAAAAASDVFSRLADEEKRKVAAAKRAEDNAFLARSSAELVAKRTELLLDPPTDQSDDTGPDTSSSDKSLAQFDAFSSQRLANIKDPELNARFDQVVTQSRSPLEIALLRKEVGDRNASAASHVLEATNTLILDAYRNPGIIDTNHQQGLMAIARLSQDLNQPTEVRRAAERDFSEKLFTGYIKGFLDRGDPSTAREMLDSGELDDVLGVDKIISLTKQIDAAERTGRKAATAGAEDHLASILATGEGNPQAAALYRATMPADAVADFDREEVRAGKVFTFTAGLIGQTPAEIGVSLEELRPLPGSVDFADANRTYLQALATAQKALKMRNADPALAAAQQPAVAELFAPRPADGVDAGAPPDFEYAVGVRMDTQRDLGTLESNVKALTIPEAKAHVAEIQGAAPGEMGAAMMAVRERYGKHYPKVLSELAEQGLDGGSRVVATLLDDPGAMARAVAAIGMDMADAKKNIPPTDVSDTLAAVVTQLEPWIAAVMAGDPTGSRLPDINEITAVVQKMALIRVRQGSSSHDAAEKAANEVINNRFTFTDTYYFPGDIDGVPINANQVATLANIKLDEGSIRAFAPAPFGTTGTLDEDVRTEAMISAASNSGYWVTNATGTGLILMVPLADGSALPLINAEGEQYGFGFNETADVSVRGAGFTAREIAAKRMEPFNSAVASEGNDEGASISAPQVVPSTGDDADSEVAQLTPPAKKIVEVVVSRAIKNNNPGNIRKSKEKWEGLAETQTDDNFFTFQTPEDGLRAMTKVLQTYKNRHDIDTIDGVIARWAPPSENDIEDYADFVAAKMGVAAADKIDLSDPGTLLLLIKAMTLMETGQAYDESLIQAGIRKAGINL